MADGAAVDSPRRRSRMPGKTVHIMQALAPRMGGAGFKAGYSRGPGLVHLYDYESGAYEAWLVDGEGKVTEGASTNAWIVTHDNELITRQTDNGILAGITRHTLKAIASKLQLKLIERPFTLAEAKKAREAFITSATSFVTPVVKIDGQLVGDGKPGATARRLREEYVRFAAEGGGTLPAGIAALVLPVMISSHGRAMHAPSPRTIVRRVMGNVLEFMFERS